MLSRDNLSRVQYLAECKTPYLFTSSNLLDLVTGIASNKTKLSIISLIGPRLLDPTAKHNELMDVFEYAEDREKVECILKKRAMVISSERYGAGYRSRRNSGAGRGVSPGRVAPGRGRPNSRASATPSICEESVEHDINKIVESLNSPELISQQTSESHSPSNYNYEYDDDGNTISNTNSVENLDSLNEPGGLLYRDNADAMILLYDKLVVVVSKQPFSTNQLITDDESSRANKGNLLIFSYLSYSC
jgi:hypothetical protein